MKILFFFLLTNVAALFTAGSLSAQQGYNGIAAVNPWPPVVEVSQRTPLLTPPYLTQPPAVIPIDIGRQLFVDDFLIADTTLARTYHHPEYYAGNPVLKPTAEWENGQAAPFSDGIFFDPADKLFKMWYVSKNNTCLATSHDGIHWEKPLFDVVPGTNIVQRDEENTARDSSTVWLDLDEKDPAKRYKMFRVLRLRWMEGDKKKEAFRIRPGYSPDGIHWTTGPDSDPLDDRSTVFKNPFRDVWVASIRAREGDGRAFGRYRRYYENVDPVALLDWITPDGKHLDKPWIAADDLDPARTDLDLGPIQERASYNIVPSQLYNLDAIAYESIMLGMFSIWRGQPVKPRPKINEVTAAYSRDGFHWTRPDRTAFCGVSEDPKAWNWGNTQSVGGVCLVVGDKLYFYVGGASGSFPNPRNVGLAFLRRDGFASMDAPASGGFLTTRPVTFKGKYLFVNVAAPQGGLRAEILDEQGKVIAPFSVENSDKITGDSTLTQLNWKGASGLSALAGQKVKFRFHLKNGSLYSFWVSPEESGASHGYVGAGGPGFPGVIDTIGKASLSK